MMGRRMVIRGQGIYYVLSGLWPIVSMSTFEAVTGPKTDDWLVHTVGVLAMAIGLALLAGATHRVPRSETVTLASVTAIAFLGVDTFYALRGTISRVYLADAALEVLFVIAVLASSSRRRGR
jgi:hypothetical protein